MITLHYSPGIVLAFSCILQFNGKPVVFYIDIPSIFAPRIWNHRDSVAFETSPFKNAF